MTAPIKTLDQRRAQHAWDALDAFLKSTPDGKARAKFAVHARRLPVRVMSSGLGQALAFLLAKNYCPDLLKALADWVLFERNQKRPPLPVQTDTLLHAVIGGDSELLQLCTAETLAYLRWLTRFVEAKKADLFPKGTDPAEGE